MMENDVQNYDYNKSNEYDGAAYRDDMTDDDEC